MLHKVLLYCTYPIPEAKLSSLLDTFNASPYCPQPDNIIPSAPADATHGMTPAEIYTHHWSKIPETAGISGDPVVVLDEQTLKDDTVVVVSQVEDNTPLMLRFVPDQAPLAVSNLQIGNQDLTTVRTISCSRRVLLIP